MGVHAAVILLLFCWEDMAIARKSMEKNQGKGNFVTLTCQLLALMPNQVLSFEERSYLGKLVSVNILRSTIISMLNDSYF